MHDLNDVDRRLLEMARHERHLHDARMEKQRRLLHKKLQQERRECISDEWQRLLGGEG